MADHLVDGQPNAKRPKLSPFQGTSDSSVTMPYFNYGLGPGQGQILGDGPPNPLQQWNMRQQQNVLANVDMLDLEKNLPDELIGDHAWGLSDHLGGKVQGPGPGALQNGIDSADGQNALRHQIQHIIQHGNKSLVNNALSMAGNQLGSKSPNLQSPPNVSIAKGNGGVVDSLSMGSLPSNMPNNVGLPTIANNGSSPQVMSSIQGMNNAGGGNMVMTNSNMSNISMAGGGLVVSSTVNKALNATGMMTGQPHHGQNHAVGQGIQNGPMLPQRSVAMPHMNARPQGPHTVSHGAMGTRMQPPGMQMPLNSINQNMPGNTPYNTYQNPAGGPAQNVQVGVIAPQQRPGGMNIPQRFVSPTGQVGPTGGGEGGIAQTQPPAPSPAQPQSGAPNSSQPVPQAAAQNQAGGQAAPSTDPEKRKLIQQQLVLLLHAHKCQRRESQANGEVWQCTLPHCKTMKAVLNHMTSCQLGKNCTMPHCSSSRQIISHWKHCVRNDCPVCLPLKQADKNRNNPNATTTTPQTTQSPNNTTAQDIKKTCDVLGLRPEGAPLGGLIQTPNLGPRMRLPGPNMPITGVRVLPSQQTPTNVSLPMGSAESAVPTPATQITPTSIQQSMTNNTLFGVGGTDAQSLNLGTDGRIGGLQPGQVTATPVQDTKEWHQSVTPDLRNHLVHKLVQAIFPTPDPQAMLDKRMHNLVAYARKVEGDMYEMANSRSEYYHLLAEKIYKIQKELEEKRQKRKEQQLQQQQPGGIPRQALQPNQLASIGPRAPGAMGQSQQVLGSNSPQLNIISCNQPTGPRVIFPGPQQQQPSQQQIPQQPQQQSQPQNVGLPGPSPTAVNNPSLSPFGQSLSQQTSTTPTHTPQFITTSNGPNLPSTSPAGSQQFNDVLKNRLAQSPSYSLPASLSSLTNQVNTTTTRLPASTPTEVTNIVQSTAGPTSVSSSRGPSPAPTTPVVNSPPQTAASLGKGMTSQERAALSAPTRSSTMSSQFAAIAAASGADEDSPPPSDGDVKGKLEQQTKHRLSEETPMDIKQEDEEMNGHMDAGGKGGIKTEIKREIKREDMEIKKEVKMEPPSPSDGAVDVKPSSMEMIPPSTGSKARKCIFKPDELRQKLMPTLEKLYRQDPESHPFRQPVDPQTLGIPDYFDIVKKPMDLSTIKKKLDIGQYTDPWEYVDDVWLMFDNAWLYNRKTSRVYRYCTKLSEVFEQEIDPVMQSMGYCCGRKYTFNPQVLCCFGKQLCTIPRDAKYYSYQNSLKAYGLGSNRYTFCQKCFNDFQGDTVTLGDDPTQAQTAIKKDQFKEMKNDHLELEQFVLCNECDRKLHQICVLHMEQIWPSGFVCEECHKKKGTKKRENKFNAKRLPPTKLGVYIETRVNNFLKKKEAGAGEVSVRVVSSSEKMVEVKPGMRGKFVDTGEMPGEFPYRAKALFAFEEIDGVDVCFFGMHVQEYGSECLAPNTRRVYIAYLDSVHFFKPRQFRTAVYHEILLGYMDYVKQLGYTMAHIWACPPSEGDDYIFHCHPTEQKIPKPKRLQDWYKKMLDKGIIERIVLDYKDILKQAMEDKLGSAAELPYFEGDFWPNVLEESIKELDQEEEEKRKQEAAEAAAIFSIENENEIGPDGKKKGQKKAKKSNKSKANQRKNSNKKSNTPQTGNDLSAKIYATMDKHKEVFFVIRLHSVQSAASLGPIQDPDPFIPCDLMDGRDAFLTLAREKHYEFSSLRRAKYSTMAMLYELHNQGQDKFVYTCNSCKKHVETRYHCTFCDDFDLCIQCYEKEGHPHKMEKLGFDLDDGSSPSDSKQTNPSDARKLSIQRCIQSLVHACQCRDANCRLASCQKMKRVVTHTKVCKRKTNGGCPICKQLIALCCFHAKHCTETKCPVPFCLNIRHKLKQQQIQQRLQQAQLLRRRMAVMNTRVPTNVMGAGGNMQIGSGSGVPPVCVPGAVSPVGTMNSSMGANALTGGNMQQPHQPGIGLKPGTQTPPANVLQVVKQVQEEAARQQAPHGVGFGKVNPGTGVPGQNMPPPQMQMRHGGHIPPGQGAGNLLPMDQWQRYPGPAQGLRQPGPQVGQTQGPLPSGLMQQANPGVGVRQSAAPLFTAGANSKQALQQLMMALKSPSTPEQQQQILHILKANPQLMAAFIKQRQQAAHVQATQIGSTSVAGNASQQLPHMLVQQQQQQQQQAGQHPNRMQAQNVLQGGAGQGGAAGQPGMQQHQQWFKQNQLIMRVQQQQQQQQQQQHQQQQQQFQQPPAYQRLPGIRQPHLGYTNQFQEQNFAPMAGLKPTPPPVPSPQGGVMGPPQGGISLQQQHQLIQSVRSPPPITSPQPNPSPRPAPSPRQPVPSPRGPQPSPHELTEMLLGQNNGAGLHPHASPAGQAQDTGDMTPQDQLTKFVEQL